MVIRKNLKAIFLFICTIITINVLSNYVNTRIDFTLEKRFTLTKKTKEILNNTNKDITITVFLAGEMPSAFKRLQKATKDLLNDYKAYSKANLKIEFIDPIAGLNLNEQESAIKNLLDIGIKPTNINIKNDAGFTQKLVFAMALITIDGKQMPVKLLQNLGGEAGNYEESINNSIENLEYIFTSSIKKVISGTNPRIGFTEGNAEPNNAFLYDAITTLAESYVVGRVNLDLITKQGLDSLKLLIIAKPLKAFTEAQKYKLNYFVMKGGRVVFSIDQIAAELDSLSNGTTQMALNRNLNLDDMLFEYGARINYNLIADANCAEIPVATGNQQGDIQMAPWLYYPILMPDTSNTLVKNIDGIRSQFASTVDTIGVNNVKKSIILTTSAYNKTYTTPKPFSLQMLAQQPNIQEFTSKSLPVAVLLAGNFKSVFVNRPVPKGITEILPQPAQSKPTQIIVIGDGDVFLNQVSTKDGSPFELGFDRYAQKNYGNKALLLNIADYFTNEDNLIALRNKEIKIRLLDKTRLRSEKAKWQIVNLVFPLLMLIFFGTFQHYYRKYKYAK